MKKVREVTLSDILDSIPVEETLEDKLKKELPLNKPFSAKIISQYYKANKNAMYRTLENLTHIGILEKSRGNYDGRNNVTLYRRIK